MKKMIRLAALLLTVILCLGSLAACKKDLNDGDDDPTGGDDSQQGTGTVFNRDELLILAENKASDYVVVMDDDIDQECRNLINTFISNFRAKSGVRLTTVNDTATVTAKELVVYKMDNRREVSEELDKLTAPSEEGYRMVVKEEKVIVAASNAYYLEAALNFLVSSVTEYPDAGTGVYGIPKNYEAKLDIPVPAGNIVKVDNVYTASGNYTLSVRNATANDYKNYLAQLEADGFTEQANNTIGSNKFSTYTHNGEAVYTMYYPSQQMYKVTYGVLGYQPDARAVSVGSATVTPSFTQIARQGIGSVGSAPGLSLIVQNSDGSYIIFDGGNTNSADKADLLQYLKDNNPNEGKPVIAGWFITHAHADHINLTNDFLDTYYNEIDLRMVGYNFPDWENISMTWEESQGVDAMSLGTLAIRFQNIIKNKYPNTETWVIHTGQVMEFPGVSMTILYTPEDLATTPSTHLGGLQTDGSVKFGSGNHTCAAYRLVINDATSVMILGDSETDLCKWMYEVYGTAMKSDILQVTHHGFNGGYLPYYQAINPDVCFWACSPEQFESGSKSYDFNQYLLNLNSYRGGKDRQHHYANTTVTYLCTPTGYRKK